MPRSARRSATTTELPSASSRITARPQRAARRSAHALRAESASRLQRRRHVTSNGLARDVELGGDPPTAPPKRCKGSNLAHDLWIDHRHLDALRWLVLQNVCVHVALDAGVAGGRGGLLLVSFEDYLPCRLTSWLDRMIEGPLSQCRTKFA